MSAATTSDPTSKKKGSNGADAGPPTSGGALRLQVRPDGVAIVTYDVPGESVNSLQASFSNEFEEIFERVERDEAIKAVVLTSGKEASFVVGANIDMLTACRTAADAEALSRAGQNGFKRLAASRKPFVAAVHGPALGGGFELALACQGRVASDDKKTVFGFPEVQLGLLPGANGLQRIAAKVGLQAALDYGLTGKNLRPAKAKKMGVVDEVVPHPLLIEVAVKRARELAARPPRAQGSGQSALEKGALGMMSLPGMSGIGGVVGMIGRLRGLSPQAALTELALEDNPVGRRLLFKKAREMTRKKTKGHYPATQAIINVLETFASRGFDASAEVEARAFGELVVGETAKQLIGIYHATQALKKDSGVADPRAKGRKVEKVGMLGAGLMGAGIAYVTANAGVPVRLKDRDDASLGRGYAYIGKIVSDRVKKKAMTRLERDDVQSKVTGSTQYDGFRRCDVVIEAVFEDLAIKQRVLADVERTCGETTIFASNTSSIPIGRIAEGSKRPQNVVGMHYFSPVEKMPLLEVIRHKTSSDEAVATAVSLGKKQGKTVIVVNDGVGFYTSRVLGPYMNEASYLLAEGVPIEVIDKALVDWGWPVGPADILRRTESYRERFGARFEPAPTLVNLAKNNGRFYKD
ncbi:MAG: fatty acid oxidation complex subunit alpha FadJ [Polyangiales bacterium]